MNAYMPTQVNFSVGFKMVGYETVQVMRSFLYKVRVAGLLNQLEVRSLLVRHVRLDPQEVQGKRAQLGLPVNPPGHP